MHMVGNLRKLPDYTDTGLSFVVVSAFAVHTQPGE